MINYKTWACARLRTSGRAGVQELEDFDFIAAAVGPRVGVGDDERGEEGQREETDSFDCFDAVRVFHFCYSPLKLRAARTTDTA